MKNTHCNFFWTPNSWLFCNRGPGYHHLHYLISNIKTNYSYIEAVIRETIKFQVLLLAFVLQLYVIFIYNDINALVESTIDIVLLLVDSYCDIGRNQKLHYKTIIPLCLELTYKITFFVLLRALY